MLKGIDISHHQRNINLSAIQTDFVIVKATEGVGYTDETCDRFYQEAKMLGKKRGVYHFARPDLGNSAIDEANWFLDQTKGYWKDGLLILDWEPSGNSIGNVEWAKQWLDKVYQVTGVRPLIYMSASVMTRFNWSSVVGGDYGLWVANYGTNNGQPQEDVFNRYPLNYWGFYALWQYTSVGRLNGYSGNLDLNYFSGDANAWDKYVGSYKEEVKPEPIVPEIDRDKERIKELEEQVKKLDDEILELKKELSSHKLIYECKETANYQIKLYENEKLYIKD